MKKHFAQFYAFITEQQSWFEQHLAADFEQSWDDPVWVCGSNGSGWLRGNGKNKLRFDEIGRTKGIEGRHAVAEDYARFMKALLVLVYRRRNRSISPAVAVATLMILKRWYHSLFEVTGQTHPVYLTTGVIQRSMDNLSAASSLGDPNTANYKGRCVSLQKLVNHQSFTLVTLQYVSDGQYTNQTNLTRKARETMALKQQAKLSDTTTDGEDALITIRGFLNIVALIQRVESDAEKIALNCLLLLVITGFRSIEAFNLRQDALFKRQIDDPALCKQHEHGTQNVQQLVNLLLMKGNIGKPGAGICPLRGHSNVQGDRTVGITEKPSAEFLARLGERYGFTPPQAPGHAAIASMQAICTGQARALICMGGNFALAMPDREASAVPLTQLDLAVHVATKLNRSHLLTARHSYILPVLGRSEIDMQKSGAQAVTVEDSMSMIHASRGVLKPAGVMLKSECAVVAGIAQAALPQSVVAWEYLVEDYDRIRNDIEAVLPEFADYNQRIRHPGGFHLINAAAERRWMTQSGKANFITSKGLLEDPSSAFNSKLVMATVRSHDQYNTTIYGMDDRYRGVFGQRDVVFMSAKQAKICRVKNGERVNLIALTPDGKRSSRRMDRLKVVIYPMADRSLVTYFPESNHMLTLDNHDPLSGIPGYKSIPVELEPSN